MRRYKGVTGMAPPKGCATYNGKKLPVSFSVLCFLVKLNAIVQALQTLGKELQPFLLGVAAFNFDPDFQADEEITKRTLFQVETVDSR
jgi:hypothetical protein